MFYEASSARTSNTQLGCHWVAAALSSFRIRCSNASYPLQFLSRDASPEALYSITPKCSQHLELRFDTANGELLSVLQKQLALELPLSASMCYYVATRDPKGLRPLCVQTGRLVHCETGGHSTILHDGTSALLTHV